MRGTPSRAVRQLRRCLCRVRERRSIAFGARRLAVPAPDQCVRSQRSGPAAPRVRTPAQSSVLGTVHGMTVSSPQADAHSLLEQHAAKARFAAAPPPSATKLSAAYDVQDAFVA